MRNDAKRAVSTTGAVRDRTVWSTDAVRRIALGLGVALAMSNAAANGQAGSDGVVHFTGALVDLYDVTFDAPSGAFVEGPGMTRSAVATLRFDAHGRRLAGAHVTLAAANGTPLEPDAGSGVRATWRDARDDRSVPLVSGRAYRVGPYGGVMTVAADDETGAVAPVVIGIRHP
ncbi:thioesterase [Burkholderia sp. Bp8992]|uniref:thioesterase n=1 Tax=unclassified Burkholderia TaxID=2613784 RepID=UPI000F5822CF|nr:MULTISPECIES: thioesterase [unclassified Burkholderia]RQS37044.1 thioesterase [Burkholderia sp. Bp8992]